MENPTGESTDGVLRLDFDRKSTLQFRGSVVTSDAGLLAYRELDAALGLAVMAGEMLADARTGQNGRHALVGLSRQSVFGRLAEYEDVTTPSVCGMIPRCAGSSAAKRLRVVRPRRAKWARFETRWLTAEKNLSALADLSDQWIDTVHARRPPRGYRARYGFEREPDARRTGEQRLERPLCLHLLSSVVPVQPVRRSGTLLAASRERP